MYLYTWRENVDYVKTHSFRLDQYLYKTDIDIKYNYLYTRPYKHNYLCFCAKYMCIY